MVVKHYSILVLFFLALGLSVASAQGPNSIKLSPQDVAVQVIEKSYEIRELLLQLRTERLATLQVQDEFSYGLLLKSSYQKDDAERATGSFGARGKTYESSLGLQKKFTTGSLLSFEYNRKSLYLDSDVYAQSATPLSTVTDAYTFKIEQSLLRNFLGRGDRAKILSANSVYISKQLENLEATEDQILASLRIYWDTYVAKKLLEESLNSRDRYAKLISLVKRKQQFGATNPGELAQVEAEYEGRDQSVKQRSADFLDKQTRLLNLLQLNNESEIEFLVSDQVPPVPKLVAKKPETLRKLASIEKLIHAADADHRLANSESLPELKVVAKLSSTGLDESASDAFSEMTSRTHPTSYVGVEFGLKFGSGLISEQKANTAAKKEKQEVLKLKSLLSLKADEDNLNRKVKSQYAIVESSLKQVSLRQKAAKEIARSYEQGRTDLDLYVRALNDMFTSQSEMARAIGDYNISLNEWAASRDELVKTPDYLNENGG